MKYSLLWLCMVVSVTGMAQTTQVDTLYSTNTKDKYVITIRKPAGFTTAKKYHHVYMTDGGIGIGDYVLGKSKSWAAVIPSNCVVIAIGHIGDYNTKRPRDFIPADITRNV